MIQKDGVLKFASKLEVYMNNQIHATSIATWHWPRQPPHGSGHVGGGGHAMWHSL